MADSTLVKTRFAPSPSGHLHVGGARTALFNWAFARKHGGRFILRIEDTDQRRSSAQASLGFLADLAWLGIDWDEGPEHGRSGGGAHGPYFQSERLDVYTRELDRLIAAGRAYRAFETAEELDAKRAEAKARNEAYRYDRAALAVDPATVAQWVAEGRPHVVRFKVPDDREVVVHDLVLGEVRVPPGELDDFVIRKADGFPTYHFAVVVDDELMGVTHVLRAQEHLYNTPKHVLLQEALGHRLPQYAHMPIISNPDGSKMSKRDKDKALRAAVKERGLSATAAVPADEMAAWLADKGRQLPPEQGLALAEELGIELPEIDVDDFRRAGYLPDVLVNYLSLLGWSPGENIERFDRAFLVERFTLERIGKSAAKFDRDKLKAFNLAALQEMPLRDFVAALRAHGEAFHPSFVTWLDARGEGMFEVFAACTRERSKSLDEPYRTNRFLVQPDDAIVIEDTKPVRKALGGGGLDRLEQVRALLAELPDWTVPGIEAALLRFAEAHAEGKLGQVAQPIRVAVSGGTVSPPIHDTLVLLGRAATLARIDRALSARPVA